MQRIIISTLVFHLAWGMALFPQLVTAQSVETTATVSAEASVDTTETQPVSVVSDISLDTSLEGVTVETSTEAPGRFGLFWRNVRERVSLATTFNPVKKAEKQLKFAEERMQLAKTIAEKSQDPKVQVRVEEMVKKATDYIADIEARRDKIIAEKSDQSNRLLKNLAAQQLRREAIFAELEESVSVERLEGIRAERDRGLIQGERLLNALQNANIPPEVKEKLEAAKLRIDTHIEEVQMFNAERKAIQDRINAGDPTALEALKTLRVERIEERKDVHADVKTVIKEVKEGLKDVRAERKAASSSREVKERMVLPKPLPTDELTEEELPKALRNPPPEQLRKELEERLQKIDMKEMELHPAEALKEAQRVKALSEQKHREVEERIEEMEREL